MKAVVVRTTLRAALPGQSSQFQRRILVGFEDYKYGLKKNTMCFILKIQLRAGKGSERHAENVRAQQSHPEVLTIRPNPGESIYSRNIKGSKVHKRLIERFCTITH